MKKETPEFNLKAILDNITASKKNAVAEQIDMLVEEANLSIAYVLFTDDGVVERVVSKEDPIKMLGAVAGLFYELQKQHSERGVARNYDEETKKDN
jgi:hypothetical protein